VLKEYGGAKEELAFQVEDGAVRYSFPAVGDNSVHVASLFKDDLSGLRYLFAKVPIAYLHHDDRINPRDIGGYLALHIALAWVGDDTGRSPVKVFDGRHKATAQGTPWRDGVACPSLRRSRPRSPTHNEHECGDNPAAGGV
jgi:hypothetical protein